MSSSIIEKSGKILKNRIPDSPEQLKCSRCGGNGYMKSSPSCYHTCLDCFGKGYLKAHKI